MTKKSKAQNNGQKLLPPVQTSKAKGTPPAAVKETSVIKTPFKSGPLHVYSQDPVVTTHHPVLQFTPYAWAKLLFMRDKASDEVGAFGISTPDDLLAVQDIAVIGQKVGSVSMEFEDEAIADFYDAQTQAGRKPAEYARIWIHTHPGSMTNPSSTDFETFNRVFGGSDWAVMFILAQNGATSCELRFHVGPKASLDIPTKINYKASFPASDIEAWEHEYSENVIRKTYTQNKVFSYNHKRSWQYDSYNGDDDDVSVWWDKNIDRPSAPVQTKSADVDDGMVDDVQEDETDYADTISIDECDWCTKDCDPDDLVYCEHCYSPYCPECYKQAEYEKKDVYKCYSCNKQIKNPILGMTELNALYSEIIDAK